MKEKMDANNFKFSEDFSVSLNFDGVPMFKSSSVSAWPVLGTVDGLPVKTGSKAVLLFGVWIGKKRNNLLIDEMIGRLLHRFDKLRTEGMAWSTTTGELRRSRVLISRVLCDSQGRPTLTKLQHLRGTFGCGYCLQERDTTDKEKGAEFPYILPMATMRTPEHIESVLINGYGTRKKFIEGKGKWFQGINGRSLFMDVPSFDVIKGA